MPVRKQQNGLEESFGAMSEVFQGFLYGEQVKRDRFVQERDYGFNLEKFDESVRQYDNTFEEQVRQFDTTLQWNAEQNEMNRDHQIYMQDDQQEFAHEETALERDSREAHQEAQRDVEYKRIREEVRMKNADRSLRYEENAIARYDVELGDSPNFSSMPDRMIVAGGNTYNPDTIDYQQVLLGISKGQSHPAIPNITKEQADQFLKVLKENPEAIKGVKVALETNGMFAPIIPNDRKAAMLEDLSMRKSGGDPEAWALMPDESKQQYRNTVIHELDNLDGAKKRATRQRLEYESQKFMAEAGASVYAGGPGGGGDPLAAFFAEKGQAFYQNEKGLPVYTMLHADKIGGFVQGMSNATMEWYNLDDLNLDEEATNYEKERILTDLKRMGKEAALADPSVSEQMNGLARWYQDRINGEPIDLTKDRSYNVFKGSPGVTNASKSLIEESGRMEGPKDDVARLRAGVSSDRVEISDILNARKKEELDTKNLQTETFNKSASEASQLFLKDHPEASSGQIEKFQEITNKVNENHKSLYGDHSDPPTYKEYLLAYNAKYRSTVKGPF